MRRLIIIAFLLAICSVFASSQDLKLFSPEIKKTAPRTQALVMDFLERYFSELPKQKHTSISTKMADDQVYFRNGQRSDLSLVTDSMPFAIKLLYRYYEVEWTKQDQPFITIVFPARYDLILGLRQDEAQHQFKDTILAAPQSTDSIIATCEKVLQDDSVYMAKTDYLELESFNDATYYIYNNVDSTFRPYFDVPHLDYSAANLFHGLIADTDYRMYVEQTEYGFKTNNYTITLRQWLDYCKAWGLKVYFGVEEQREDGLLALVITQSAELGFNHMLSVVIPDKFVTDQNAVLKARMTPYIPTYNIKNLFQNEIVNHRKIKWQ